MKKKIIIVILLLIIICLIPIKGTMQDGGSIRYKAILYEVTNYHQNNETYIKEGIEVKILNFVVYDNIKKTNI